MGKKLQKLIFILVPHPIQFNRYHLYFWLLVHKNAHFYFFHLKSVYGYVVEYMHIRQVTENKRWYLVRLRCQFNSPVYFEQLDGRVLQVLTASTYI